MSNPFVPLVDLASDIADALQFRDTVTVKPHSGTTVDAQPSYGSAVTYNVVVLPGGERLVEDRNGRQVLPMHLLLFFEDLALNVKDQVTMPDSSTPRIIKVDRGVRESAYAGLVTKAWVGEQ